MVEASAEIPHRAGFDPAGTGTARKARQLSQACRGLYRLCELALSIAYFFRAPAEETDKTSHILCGDQDLGRPLTHNTACDLQINHWETMVSNSEIPLPRIAFLQYVEPDKIPP